MLKAYIFASLIIFLLMAISGLTSERKAYKGQNKISMLGGVLISIFFIMAVVAAALLKQLK